MCIRDSPKAALIRMNQEFPKVPEKIKDRSVEIAGDIGEALAQMRSCLLYTSRCV